MIKKNIVILILLAINFSAYSASQKSELVEKYKAVNKYGISKSITYDKIKSICKEFNFKLKSIFITNPWGILEEKKLNYYLY